MDEVIRKSLEKLNYEIIRPMQEKVVKEYLNGSDVLLCSPTGSGKSLTFEIAPFAFKYLQGVNDATVIVVSPLVALMQYQAEGLTKKGVNAAYLQDVFTKSGDITLEDLQNGKCDVIFASPESLLGEHRSLVTKLSKSKMLKVIFIDEAHCIKKYGKGNKKHKVAAYRPHYGQLGELRSLVERDIPMVALTATATKDTREIIMKDLCMTKCTQVIINPNKHNVKYSVVNCGKDISKNFKWLLDLLVENGANCPRIIIFFRQIRQISEVYEYLETQLGMKQFVCVDGMSKNGYWNRVFGMFHLTTSEKIKHAICSLFQEEGGVIRVVLCSTSFSMGLDVKDVHTDIHYGPANDIDDYLQESGRAGRNPSVKCDAVLLKYKQCLSSQNITAAMKNYVKAETCRRLQLLKPFSEEAQSLLPKHSCCDICASICRCACLCAGSCVCSNPCSGSDSAIMSRIRDSLKTKVEPQISSDSSSNEEFSSDSDIEKYISKKPHAVALSDSE